jgi:perosamine synthetase
MKFIDQYHPNYSEKAKKALHDFIDSDTWFTEHHKTREFEEKISQFLGMKHTNCVNNGTISLSIALLACGIQPKDVVVVPDLTMMASATAVQFIGATPIFIDIEPNTLTLDIRKTIDLIIQDPLSRIKAVIFVSLNGRTNPLLGALKNVCENRNIALIEDAAQSFGSSIYKEADIISFSFSPHKLVSCGQGGCLVTNDDDLALKIKRLKNFGRDLGGEDRHDWFGINSKFTDLQAVLGLSQLEEISINKIKKTVIYHSYYVLLNGNVEIFSNEDYLPWFVDVYFDSKEQKERVKENLKKNNIGYRDIYPPLHTQKCFDLTNQYPIGTDYSSRGLWLPSSLDLSYEDIIFITEKIKEAL